MKDETQKIITELKKEKKKQKNEKPNDSLNKYIDLDKEIASMNMKIVAEAEKQKNELRDKLVIAVKHIIWFQLVFFNIVVMVIVLSVTSKFPFFQTMESELIIRLFDFLEYYIGATIVELLGMLGFILHYVFSKFQIRKDKDKKKIEIENKNDEV